MTSWRSSPIIKWIMASQIHVHLLLLSVQFSFSGFHVIGKGALEYIEPLVFVFLRCSLGSLCLFFLAPLFTLPYFHASSTSSDALETQVSVKDEEDASRTDGHVVELQEVEVKYDEESASPTINSSNDYDLPLSNNNNSINHGCDNNNNNNNSNNNTVSVLSENPANTTSSPIYDREDETDTRHLLTSSSSSHASTPKQIPSLTNLAYWRSVMWPSSAVIWAELVMCGLLGVAANQSLFILGLNATSPANAAIFQPLCPIITTTLAVFLRQENVSCLKFSGIFLAVFGAVGMVVSGFLWGGGSSSSKEGSPVFSGASAWGNLFFLGNTTVFSCYLILQKRLLNRGFPPVITTAWSFFFGAVALGLVTLAFPGSWAALPSMPSMVWIALTYAVLVATVYGFGANTITTKLTTPTVVSIYVTVQPVSSTFLAWIFLDDPLRWYRIVGTILIISGVVTVFIAKNREEKRELDALSTRYIKESESDMDTTGNEDDIDDNGCNNNDNDNKDNDNINS